MSVRVFGCFGDFGGFGTSGDFGGLGTSQDELSGFLRSSQQEVSGSHEMSARAVRQRSDSSHSSPTGLNADPLS